MGESQNTSTWTPNISECSSNEENNYTNNFPNSRQQGPFQWQVFADFVKLVGRLFYDDACIVLLDLFARQPQALLESEIREVLGWRESLIQQKLNLLERHLLVVQDANPTRNRLPNYWRVNDNLYSAVQWRYQKVVERLTKLVEDAHQQHEFECSREGCDAQYTALEAASCDRTLEHEHPLCNKCGGLLKASEFEETKQQAKEKRLRALQQLQPLAQGLLQISTMHVPVFKPLPKGPNRLTLSSNGGVNSPSDGGNAPSVT